MDPVANPFAPGAGSRPPEFAGRDEIISTATIALRRVAAGRHAKSQMLLGLRGVGKTVLLNRIAEIAEDEAYLTAIIEAPEGRRLASMLVPVLRRLLFKLSRVEKARAFANQAMGALRGFASAFKVKYGDLEIAVDSERGVAASGDLESDLPELLLIVARAARAADKPVAVFIDEVQYLHKEDLSALIVSFHKIAQGGLPLVLFGAGLPQLAALAGEAKSYAERLFDFPPVGALGPEAGKRAVREPVREAGADIGEKALDRIMERTAGYPYFLQEWASHAWNVASRSPIRAKDVDDATAHAVRALDASFFRVRLDRLTPREKDYLRAMAELGPGPHRSGDIAAILNIDVTTAGPLRTGLIRKGMIYSQAHGETAFTVPMFDTFMRRAIPEWTSQASAKRERQ